MKSRDWREINSEYARVYTDFRGDYSRKAIRFILQQAALPPRPVIVDLATGAGAVLRQLTGPKRFVAGLDASILMLQQAQARAYRGGRPPLACADGQLLPLVVNSVDLITIGQAIHWFDLPALFHELRRVLRPGGMLAVLSRYPSPAGWVSPLVEQIRYPFTEEGRAGTPQWTALAAPSNLLGLEQGGFIQYRRDVFSHRMKLSLEGYLRGQAERANRRERSAAEQEQFLQRLRAALETHAPDGWLTETFFDTVFTARKPA